MVFIDYIEYFIKKCLYMYCRKAYRDIYKNNNECFFFKYM